MCSFIRCPECGFCIGKYAEFINIARQSIYRKEVFGKESKFADYKPEKMCFNPHIVPDIKTLFDAVGIKKRCCRMHIITKTEFDKIYK